MVLGFKPVRISPFLQWEGTEFFPSFLLFLPMQLENYGPREINVSANPESHLEIQK